jgi:hypothetical protein
VDPTGAALPGGRAAPLLRAPGAAPPHQREGDHPLLRNLERDGLVERCIAGRAVLYALTPLGRSLLEPLDVLCAWTAEHWEELLDARDPVS